MRKSKTTQTESKKEEKKKKKAPTKRSQDEKRIAELESRTREFEHRNEELQVQKKELQDRLLRLAAEFDNYKKRTAREFQQVMETANRDLILQLIDVLDNFQRALDSAKSAKDFDAFHKGVELIYAHLNEILTREGLQLIEAVGQPFDPHRHEAVMQVDDDEHPADIIVDQTQPGYLLRDKLLRASRVIVSRGPRDSETVIQRSEEGQEEEEASTQGA
jgi:molecular chaperone GrpE